MEAGGSSSSHGQNKKSDKIRRSWSQKEEEVLIAYLKDLVASGWKGENGFKVGYLQLLEQKMAKAFPGTDLCGLPHINLKLHVWKKNYGSLVTMLSRSGVGWNDTTKMAEATDEAWDHIVKTDLNVRPMRFKAWPYYHDWSKIFGKDRVTGEQAEDVMDAVNELLNTNCTADNIMADNFNINLDYLMEKIETNSICQPQRSGSKTKSYGKKRKSDTGNEGLYELLGSFCRNTEAILGDIAHRIGYEYDVSTSQKQVYDIMCSIHGLTLQDKLNVPKLLIKNTEYLELFSSLPDDARIEFVRQLLGGMV